MLTESLKGICKEEATGCMAEGLSLAKCQLAQGKDGDKSEEQDKAHQDKCHPASLSTCQNLPKFGTTHQRLDEVFHYFSQPSAFLGREGLLLVGSGV